MKIFCNNHEIDFTKSHFPSIKIIYDVPEFQLQAPLKKLHVKLENYCGQEKFYDEIVTDLCRKVWN